MKSSMIINSDNYGERVILKREYISSDKANAESVLVLKELLNVSLLSQKKSVQCLKGGTLIFDAYSYRGGYVLEGTLIQSKTKGLSYIFKDPYKAGFNLLSNFGKSNILSDEKNFAISKERVLGRKYLDKNRSARSVLFRELGYDYAPISFDEKRIMDVKIEEVFSAFSAFCSSDIGDYLYLGDPSKKNPLDNVAFDKDISSLPFAKVSGGNDFISDEALKDIRVFQLHLNKKIEKESDYFVTKQALYVLEESVKKQIKKNFGSEVNVHSGVIDNENVYLTLETTLGKLPILDGIISFEDEKEILLPFADSFDDSFIGYNTFLLKNAIYPEYALKEMKRRKDIGVADGVFFYNENNSKEDVLALVSSMRVSFSASLSHKEKNND